MENLVFIFIVFVFAFAVLAIRSYNSDMSNIIDIMQNPENKGKSRKDVENELFRKNALTSAGIALLIAFGFFLIVNTGDGLFKKKPQPKIENPYEGSKEQKEDIDFANELIKDDINK